MIIMIIIVEVVVVVVIWCNHSDRIVGSIDNHDHNEQDSII